MSGDERTRKYVARRSAEGKTIREIMRGREALRRPRALPAPRTRLTKIRVAACPTNAPTPTGCPFQRSAGPSPEQSHSAPRGFIQARPQHEWPITGLPAPPKQPLDKHRSIDLERVRQPSSVSPAGYSTTRNSRSSRSLRHAPKNAVSGSPPSFATSATICAPCSVSSGARSAARTGPRAAGRVPRRSGPCRTSSLEHRHASKPVGHVAGRFALGSGRMGGVRRHRDATPKPTGR